MGNGTDELKVAFGDVLAGVPGATGRVTDIILNRLRVHILELEDVLFHHASCVMMPARPVGPSGGGGSPSASQDRLSGLEALAACLLFAESHPQKHYVVAGHTDTSGAPPINFTLSGERARNVLFLLQPSTDLYNGQTMRQAWASNSAARQKIEDYQQILKWVAETPGLAWGCDPGVVNDAWSDRTRDAVRAFVARYNRDYAPPRAAMGILPIPPATPGRVETVAGHHWPVELWQAVYDLYRDQIAAIAKRKPGELDALCRCMVPLDKNQLIIACGESYPIDAPEQANYRSQRNRRVEVLFFNRLGAPPLKCSPDTAAPHPKAVCPIWHRELLFRDYIDPLDVRGVEYHLRFTYFDRIRSAWTDVPAGLEIRAYDENQREIHSRTKWDGGVYAVKVLDDPARKEIHFDFTARDQWLFTKDDTSNPVLQTIPRADVRKKPIPERLHYYDLPDAWYSTNYWTRDPAAPDDADKGARYQDRMRSLSIKPFDRGGNLTTAAAPLLFSLDDVVLLATPDSKDQILKDENGLGTAVPLSGEAASPSRAKYLCVDPANGRLKLHQPTDGPSSRLRFAGGAKPENLLTHRVPHLRIVAFRNGFYTVTDHRTNLERGALAQGFIQGARAAVREDPEVQFTWPLKVWGNEFAYTGDFDLHYFHGLHARGEKPISYLLYVASVCFMIDVRNPATLENKPLATPPTDADVQLYVKMGCYNAMDHWNRKNYWLEESGGGPKSLIIIPFRFFDEKETFQVAAAERPTGNFDQDGQRGPILKSDGIKNAHRKARGGRPKYLAFICRDDNAPRPYGLAYHLACRNGDAVPFSIFKLNKSGYLNNADAEHKVVAAVPMREFGQDFGLATFAHELGHATGQPDEYVKSAAWTLAGAGHSKVKVSGVPEIDQYYVPYCMQPNGTSMMYYNGAPRLHHLWYAMHKLRQEEKHGHLHDLIGDKQFVACFDADGREYRYTRNPTGLEGNPARMMLPLHDAAKYDIPGAPQRQISLALHYVGDDESSRDWFHPGQNGSLYEAVLVARILVVLTWWDDAADRWTAAQKQVRLDDLTASLRQLEEKYRLRLNDGAAIQNIYVHFRSGFSQANDARCHYTLECRKSGPPAGSRIPVAGSRITWHEGVSADEIRRYFIHQEAGKTELEALGFLETWVRNRTHRLYVLGAI